MKHFWLLFSFVSICLGPVNAASDTSALNKSKQAYFEKRYDDAVAILSKEAEQNPQNPAIFFNLGLSFKALKKYPNAILAFEKALHLKPNDSESIQLIEACYLEMDSGIVWKDNIGTLKRSLFSLGSNFWSVLSIVFSVITALFLLMMGKASNISRKKVRLGFAVACALGLLTSLYVASETYAFEHDHDYAIVLEKDIPVYKSANSATAEPSTVSLKPGSKVRILSWNRDHRIEIETSKGQKLFVSSGIERI